MSKPGRHLFDGGGSQRGKECGNELLGEHVMVVEVKIQLRWVFYFLRGKIVCLLIIRTKEKLNRGLERLNGFLFTYDKFLLLKKIIDVKASS